MIKWKQIHEKMLRIVPQKQEVPDSVMLRK